MCVEYFETYPYIRTHGLTEDIKENLIFKELDHLREQLKRLEKIRDLLGEECPKVLIGEVLMENHTERDVVLEIYGLYLYNNDDQTKELLITAKEIEDGDGYIFR